MLVQLLKCLHVILAMSLIGLLLFSLLTTRSNKTDALIRTNKITLALGLLALLTGSALVIPRHYTFHTSWIRAAYVLLPSFILCLLIMTFYKKRLRGRSLRYAYVFLLALLIILVRDAITKNTLFNI